MRTKLIKHLTEEGAKESLKAILAGVQESVDDLTEETVKGVLEDLVDSLDLADQDDAFGTQGWRYRFGV